MEQIEHAVSCLTLVSEHREILMYGSGKPYSGNFKRKTSAMLWL